MGQKRTYRSQRIERQAAGPLPVCTLRASGWGLDASTDLRRAYQALNQRQHRVDKVGRVDRGGSGPAFRLCGRQVVDGALLDERRDGPVEQRRQRAAPRPRAERGDDHRAAPAVAHLHGERAERQAAEIVGDGGHRPVDGPLGLNDGH